MNVLIINLTRFGDLVQTQPVISGYKSLGHKVGLVCLENFASAVSLLDGVDEVFPFSGAGMLAKLDSDWRIAIREAVGFKANILESFPPDRTINLTPSIASRLLTYDLTPKSGDVVGFSVDEFGFNADTSLWAAFLQMAAVNRGASPFNICDIFRRTAGLKDEGNSLELAAPSVEVLDDAQKRLEAEAPKESSGFVAFQMGASEDRRRWPVASFVELADAVWERDKLIPILLGTKNEAELGKRFRAKTNTPAIDLIGETSLLELGGVLKQSKALVTNDTGTMHFAAGLGVPICSIFLATAQPFDTGPYRAGNLSLEPDMGCHPCEFGKPCPNEHACREVVTAEVMYSALSILLNNKTGSTLEGARVWQSKQGENGFMELFSLSGHDDTDRALWIAMQRAHYLPFLDGQFFEGRTGLAGRMSPDFAEEISKTLTSASDMLFLLSQQGMLLVRNPREQAKAKFLASWQRLQNILASNDHLNLLGSLWMFESQQTGNELGALLEMTERYRNFFASLQGEFV